MKRPFPVTLLAIVSGILAVITAIIALRFLGLFPFLGPLNLRVFNFWYALMYGLLCWVYIWLTRMLWRVDPSAWLFLAVITVFNLCMNFIIMVTGGEWSDVDVSTILNALVLIYIVLPSTKRAFGMDKTAAA